MISHPKCGWVRTLCAVVAMAAAPMAFAGPPAIGPSIQGAVPGLSQTSVINLRATGAISGSGPINIDPASLQFTVNGVPSGVVSVQLTPNNGPGHVCVILTNGNYTPSAGPAGLTFAIANNFTGLTDGPQNVSFTGTAGPTTNINDPACNDPNTPPVANAGPDRTVSDAQPVTLDGSLSGDANPDTTLTYQWTVNGTPVTAEPSNSPITTVTLAPGVYTAEVTVTDDSGDSDTNTATDSAVITVVAAAPPTANAGPDQTLPDTDSQSGEPVTLTGSGTPGDAGSTIVSYQWFRGQELLGSGATLATRLEDGISIVTLVVTDSNQRQASDDVQITVGAPNAEPVVNAGEDRTVPDTDRLPGEPVTLTGTATPASERTIAGYEWFLGDTSLGTGSTLQARLPDGVNLVTLVATDNIGQRGSDQVQITVVAPAVAPTVNAGADRTVADTDRQAGENVTLTGTATSPNGTIASYEWLLGQNSLGTGATLQARLGDGANIVTLRVTDSAGQQGTDTVTITVGAPPQKVPLASLPNLDPNQRKIATALDRVCTTLDNTSQLTTDQQALRARCDGLYFNNTTANQVQALDELVSDDFAVVRTQTLLFANTQYASVMDRLMALRGGARGLSLAGLNIIVDGKAVPLAQLQDMAKKLLGGGASADSSAADSSSADAGGLLSDKWGMWARGNYSFGDKDPSRNSPSFDAKQWTMVGGIDYRLSDTSVVGLALAYGQSSIDFNPRSEGALDTDTWAASLYGSVYAAKNFYFDGIVNIANAGYTADRNITYVDGTGLINADAAGDTDGMTYSAGLSGGYDFLIGGLTLSPNLGVFYIDATIDGFTETGATGLNLLYDEQKFKSLTANLGLRMTYAWNLSWGVLLPHLRIDYVREFEDDVDVFGVRFAADPNAASAPPILVETDNPDTSYWRLATGFSAQFVHGVSGYIEYQRLESFEFISFQDVSVGLRFQRSF